MTKERVALESILSFVTDPERGKHWDAWRAYIANGGKASWPRDAFESVLDWIAEEAREALAADEPTGEHWLVPKTTDQYTVYAALDEKAQKRTSMENVLDVLGAIGRIVNDSRGAHRER